MFLQVSFVLCRALYQLASLLTEREQQERCLAGVNVLSGLLIF